MNSKRLFRRAAGLAAALLALGALTFAGRNDFGLGRNTEILINLMRELSLNYVDEVSPDRLMQQAAAGMTRTLDPYTEFMPEEQMSDFELLTTGKYGGVGSLIRKKGDYVIFAQPYKGSPADRAGIRIGDRIVRIDGQEARGMTIEQVSALLKGSPGTKVKLTVERLLGGEQQELTLRRERIAIPSVPYYGYVADGIGYIQHSDFTEGSYDELRAALEALQREGELRGLILDYRSNGGGILQEAVKIVSLFVPKGTEVVSTRGRAKDAVLSGRAHLRAGLCRKAQKRRAGREQMPCLQRLLHDLPQALCALRAASRRDRAVQNHPVVKKNGRAGAFCAGSVFTVR